MSTQKIISRGHTIYKVIRKFLVSYADVPSIFIPDVIEVGEGTIHRQPWLIGDNGQFIITFNSIDPYKVKVEIGNENKIAQKLLDIIMDIDDYNFKHALIVDAASSFAINNVDNIQLSFNLEYQIATIRFTVAKFK